MSDNTVIDITATEVPDTQTQDDQTNVQQQNEQKRETQGQEASASGHSGAADEDGPRKGADIPGTLPVLAVRDVVVFNYMILPLFIGRDKSVHAVEAALEQGRHLFVCTQKDENNEDPSPDDL